MTKHVVLYPQIQTPVPFAPAVVPTFFDATGTVQFRKKRAQQPNPYTIPVLIIPGVSRRRQGWII